MKELKFEEVLSVMRLFTTKTDLTPKWNNDKPAWMAEPYFAKGYMCATNGAVGIFIDPTKFDWDIPVVLDTYEKGYPKLPKSLPLEKRRPITAEWLSENISDINECGYWTINIGEAQYYEEFWRPIKAAFFLLGAKEITMMTEATEEGPLVMELMDGITVVIMPYLEEEDRL